MGVCDRTLLMVPRTLMCSFVWVGFILIFIGLTMVVAGQHTDPDVYVSWGSVVISLGLVFIVICIILCLHAYCMMRRGKPDVRDMDIAHNYYDPEFGYLDPRFCSRECLMDNVIDPKLMIVHQEMNDPSKFKTEILDPPRTEKPKMVEKPTFVHMEVHPIEKPQVIEPPVPHAPVLQEQVELEKVDGKPPARPPKMLGFDGSNSFPVRTQSVKTPAQRETKKERRLSQGNVGNSLEPPSYEDVTSSNVSVYDNVSNPALADTR